MIINPKVEKKIQDYFQNYLLNHGNKCSVYSLLHSYCSDVKVSELEIRNVFNNSLQSGHLKITNENNSENDEYSTFVALSFPFSSINENNEISIVVSSPMLQTLSFINLKKRNEFIDSKDCFRFIFKSATKELRICSPFMQKNVIDAFPEIKTLFANSLNRGVHITILSRELFGKRSNELEWVKEIAKQTGNSDLLQIFDYHYGDLDTNKVFSSTHAKLLIADHNFAYLGSAELRQNSLSANFEVGCMLKGNKVHEICEIFDYMVSYGEAWD
ncbi:phospholipase D-like domain-containing protein [Methanococcoides sp. FTZ1]|uniref:phospholipase D-like domain-containing protein n=1 Tax=Methanococcoides sp. FTZ1 TaxID=3439061 RepID=UPI003F860CB2